MPLSDEQSQNIVNSFYSRNLVVLDLFKNTPVSVVLTDLWSTMRACIDQRFALHYAMRHRQREYS